MLITQSSDCRVVSDFSYEMASSEMIHLLHEQVVNIEHDLCQKPIVFTIFWRVDQAGVGVGSDRQRKEVSAGCTDIEIRIASCSELCTWRQCTLIAVINIEEATSREEALQGLAGYVHSSTILNLERQRAVCRWVETPHRKRIEGQSFH